MPELPGTFLQPPAFGMMLGQSDDGRLVITEVERATKLLRDISKGKKVVDVDTTEDTIIFAGVTHEEFVRVLNQLH